VHKFKANCKYDNLGIRNFTSDHCYQSFPVLWYGYTMSSQVDVLTYTYKTGVCYINITMSKHNSINVNNTGTGCPASASLSEAKLT